MSELSKRIRVQSGADAVIIFRMKNNLTKDPLDLTGMTSAIYKFENRDGGNFILKSGQLPAAAAYGTHGGIKFTAVTAGSAGNNILLKFNGTSTISAVLAVWNTANPGNTVSAQAGANLATVLPSGDLNLEFGYDPYNPVEVFGNPLLGKIRVTLKPLDTLKMKIGVNQTINSRMDFGATGPRRVANYQNLLDVVGEDFD